MSDVEVASENVVREVRYFGVLPLCSAPLRHVSLCACLALDGRSDWGQVSQLCNRNKYDEVVENQPVVVLSVTTSVPVRVVRVLA